MEAPATVRDWDILDAIIASLKATNAFVGVYASDLPDLGGKQAGYKSIAVVSPDSADETEGGYDDPDETQWVRKVTYKLSILVRDKDPKARDRAAERLLNVARTAIDADASIASTTIIGLSHIYRDRYLPAVPPERTIEATGTFSYFINGPDGHSTDP